MSGKNCLTQKGSKLSFDQNTRLIHDNCYVDAYEMQTSGPGNYARNNLRDCRCGAPKARKLCLSQPNVNFGDGFGNSGINGCNIDVDSELRNNRKGLTNLNCIQTLSERPFKTVPYMGRGVGDIKSELDIKQGKQTWVSKSCNTLADMDYTDYHMTPLIDDVRKNIQNPNNLVEEAAAEDWVRGGIPSRQLIRNKEFLESCGYKETGNAWVNPNNAKH